MHLLVNGSALRGLWPRFYERSRDFSNGTNFPSQVSTHQLIFCLHIYSLRFQQLVSFPAASVLFINTPIECPNSGHEEHSPLLFSWASLVWRSAFFLLFSASKKLGARGDVAWHCVGVRAGALAPVTPLLLLLPGADLVGESVPEWCREYLLYCIMDVMPLVVRYSHNRPADLMILKPRYIVKSFQT